MNLSAKLEVKLIIISLNKYRRNRLDNIILVFYKMKKERNKEPIQPVSGTKVPRYAGPNTFARLPELRDVENCDVAIVGVPFDSELVIDQVQGLDRKVLDKLLDI